MLARLAQRYLLRSERRRGGRRPRRGLHELSQRLIRLTTADDKSSSINHWSALFPVRVGLGSWSGSSNFHSTKTAVVSYTRDLRAGRPRSRSGCVRSTSRSTHNLTGSRGMVLAASQGGLLRLVCDTAALRGARPARGVHAASTLERRSAFARSWRGAR